MKRFSSRFLRSRLARFLDQTGSLSRPGPFNRSSPISRSGSVKRKKPRRVQMESLETRHLLAAVSGEVYADSNADGLRQSDELGVADVRVFVDTNANGRFDLGNEALVTTDVDGRYSFPSLAGGDVEIRILPEPGLVQTAPAVNFGWDDRVVAGPDGEFFRAAQLFQTDNNGQVQTIGQPTASRMDGLVRTASGALIGVDTRANQVFRIDPFNGERTRIAQTNLDIVGGLAYDRVTDTIFTLVRGSTDSTNRVLARINVNTAQTTLIGPGLSGLTRVSDLTFDTVNRRVLGFDDADNQFFAFDLQGNGQVISVADRAIDSGGITIADPALLPDSDFAGNLIDSTFVLMFDDDDNDRTATFLVNVDTGEVFDSNDSSLGLRPTALARSALGNNAQNVSLEPTQILGGVDFGLTDDVIGFRLTPLTPETGAGSLSQAGVTVVGGAIGDDFVEITLNRRPLSNVVLNLELVSNFAGQPGAVLDVDQLTFTPLDWNTPRRVTISPDIDNPVVVTTTSTLNVSVDILNSDVLWRTLPVQQLPVRTLPEPELVSFDRPVISEILVDARFTSGFSEDNDQYIELRGAPGQVLPAGTHFVVVEERGFIGGRVYATIDLSGQTFGANGFLVIQQSGSIDEVSLSASVLRSTSNGFAGLPNGIYSGPTDGVIDPLSGDASYFLIQSPTPPVVGESLDSDNDGVIDPNTPAALWTTLDAVGMHQFSSSIDNSLAPIVFVDNFFFREALVTQGSNGGLIVSSEGYGYLGRIGDSIGSEFNDWVSGTVHPIGANFGGIETDTAGRFELSDEEISFNALFDRPLDHIGSSNFVGGVRGVVELLPSADDVLAGTSADTRLPAEGVSVFVDTNENGIRDSLVFEVDPDSVVPPFDILNPEPFDATYSLTNAFPGVAISSDFFNGASIEDEIVSARQRIRGQSIGNRVFSRGSFDGFTDLSRLRFDFHNPIESASIEVVQRDFTTQLAFGRLDAFNEAGELVATSLSTGATGALRGRVTVSAPGTQIVRIEAYADDTVNQSSIFVGFDSFSYVQPEPAAATDQNGIFEISGLFPGSYSLRVEDTAEVSNLVSANVQPFEITRYDNFFFESEFRPNSPPRLFDGADFNFIVDENSPESTFVGRIPGFDADLEPLTYEFVGGDSRGLQFQIQADGSADIVLDADANLDFETEPQRILTVRISDQLSSTTARVTLQVNNVNESPIVSPNELAVTEDMVINDDNPDGLTIGLIDAFDPDTGTNEGLSYEVIGGSDVFDENNQVIGNATDFFEVDADSGVVSLIQTPNFEIVQLFTIQVRVSDDHRDENGQEDFAVTIAEKNIRVGDENDAPTINATSFPVSESATGDLFRLQVEDPDVGQSHAFALVNPPKDEDDIFGVRSDGTVFLRPGETLDFDSNTPSTLTVVVSDNGSPPRVSTHVITVNLENVDEPASIRLPGPTEPQLEISEDVDSTTQPTFIALELRDPEGLHADYSFELLPGPNSDRFRFDPVTGILQAQPGALDFETMPQVDLSFEIFDRTGQIATTQQTITVQVLNEDEPPVILTDEIIVSESTVGGGIVGRVRVADSENSPLSISVGLGTANSSAAELEEFRVASELFEFADPNTQPFELRLKDDASLNFEGDRDEFKLFVVVNQVGSGIDPVQQVITIGLNEVNEEPFFDPIQVAQLLPIDTAPGVDAPLQISPFGFTLTLPTELATDPDPLPVRPDQANPNLVRPELIFRVGEKVFEKDGQGNVIKDSEENPIPVINEENGRQRLELPSWLTYDAETQTIIGDFSNGFTPVSKLTIRALESGPLPLASDIDLTLPNIEPTNPQNRFDVNDDGDVTPIDALRVINYLNGNRSAPTTLTELFDQIRFLDVSRAVDGISQITSLDAVQLINEINRIEGATNVTAVSEPISVTQTQFADGDDDERIRREQAVDAALGQAGLF